MQGRSFREMALAIVAAAAAVSATAGAFGMAVGAGVATEILAVFCDRLTGIDDAQARFAGTFHLGNSGHGGFPRNR